MHTCTHTYIHTHTLHGVTSGVRYAWNVHRALEHLGSASFTYCARSIPRGLILSCPCLESVDCSGLGRSVLRRCRDIPRKSGRGRLCFVRTLDEGDENVSARWVGQDPHTLSLAFPPELYGGAERECSNRAGETRDCMHGLEICEKLLEQPLPGCAGGRPGLCYGVARVKHDFCLYDLFVHYICISIYIYIYIYILKSKTKCYAII